MRLIGSGIHHRSKLHRSSMRDTLCHRFPTRTATGSCSGPSRTATGIGIERGLMASSPEGSMETCTVRISGAGCQGATSTTLYRACLPFMRAWSCRSTSTSRRCRSFWASRKRPICTPDAPEERLEKIRAIASTGAWGWSDSNWPLTMRAALSQSPTVCLKWTAFSQEGARRRVQQRAALPAYRPRIWGRE